VAKPSQSLWESMYAALWQLNGVRRVAGYENPTHEYDANGCRRTQCAMWSKVAMPRKSAKRCCCTKTRL